MEDLAETRGDILRYACLSIKKECDMGFGKGALLWLLGIPLPIILLLALFWR